MNPLKTLFFILAFFTIPYCAYSFESDAPIALLMDFNTKDVLYQKDGYRKMHPSSMSKLMTLYIAFSDLKSGKIKMDDTVIVSENAWKTGGSRMFVEVGKRVTVEELLMGVIVQSGNDASVALAEFIGGDEKTFVERMNKTAQELGLKQSSFENCYGMPHYSHMMSAYDLAILSREIIKDFPEYYKLFSTKDYTYNNITQPNRNLDIGVMGIDGIKTGHTDSGGYGIASSAIVDGRRLIVIVNGLNSEKARLDAAREILQYGLENFKNFKSASKNYSMKQIDVWHGNKSYINAIFPDDIEIVIPNSVNTKDIKVTLESASFVEAPISEGQTVATLTVEYGDNKQVFELVSDTNVKYGSWINNFIQNIQARLRLKY